MNDRLVLTDDLLRRALEQRMAHSPSPLLLERIVAGAAETTQERSPGGWLRRRRRAGVESGAGPRRWARLPALAGLAAAAIVTVLVGLAIRPVVTVPGSTPSPQPTPTLPGGATPAPTPEAILLGDHAAIRVRLGPGAGPFDVKLAFDSIWVANSGADDVRRFDPGTLVEEARIPLPGAGPAWMIAIEDEIWVTNQVSGGLTRIDPGTNEVVGTVGSGIPCGAPIEALGDVWQSYCDGDSFQRLDPVTKTILDTFAADGHDFINSVGDRLITESDTGLVEMDPETGTFTDLPGTVPGFVEALPTPGTFDSSAIWARTATGVERIDPATGESVASFPYADARGGDFADGRLWLTVELVGVLEIDLATNAVVQTIPVEQTPNVATLAGGALYVTDFANSNLWRIQP